MDRTSCRGQSALELVIVLSLILAFSFFSVRVARNIEADNRKHRFQEMP